MNGPSRRELLLLAGTTIGTTSGCLDLDSAGDATASRPTDTQSTETTRQNGERTVDASGRLFTENLDEEPATLTVELLDRYGAEDSPIRYGEYRVPPRTGLRFGRIEDPGSQCVVRCRRWNGFWESILWEVQACAPDGTRTEGGEQQVHVLVEDGSVRIVRTGCDALGRFDVDYVAAEEHQLE